MTSITTAGPSAQTWETFRPTIKQLYLEEKRSLKEVMTIMKTDHNFTASIQMYKKRISKWSIDKNCKAEEMNAIAKRKVQRDAIGKDTTFKARDRKVDIENVVRYFKRRGFKTLQEVFEAHPEVKTPSDITYYTPKGSPKSENLQLTKYISPPNNLVEFEEVIWTFRKFYIGSLDSNFWKDDDQGFLVSAKATTTPKRGRYDDNLCSFWDYCYVAVHCLEERQYVQARQMLIKACDLATAIFTAEDPALTFALLEIYSYYDLRGFGDAFSKVLQHLTQTIQTLPSVSPGLKQVFAAISLIQDDLLNMLQEIWTCALDVLKQRLTSSHKSWLDFRIIFLEDLGDRKGLAEAEVHLRQTLNTYTEVYGDWEASGMSHKLIQNLVNQKKGVEAEKLGWQLIYQIEKSRWPKEKTLHFLYLISWALRIQGKHEESVVRLEELIVIRTVVEGESSPALYSDLLLLEKWLIEDGLYDEACVFAQKGQDMLGSPYIEELIE